MLRIFLALWFAIMPAFAWAGSMTLMGVGGSAAFSPAQLPNLVAWYKADAGVFTDTGCSTPATNTQTVACWADQSGHGYNLIQGTAGKQPEFLSAGLDSKQAIQCIAANTTGMVTASGIAMGTGTTGSGFAAAQMTTNAVAFSRLFVYAPPAASDASAGGAAYAIRNNSLSAIETDQAGTVFGTRSVSLNTTFQFGVVFDGTNGTTYLNGSAGTPTANSHAFISAGFIGICNSLGSGGALGSTYFDGPISEIVITSSALNSTQIAQLTTYLNRW